MKIHWRDGGSDGEHKLFRVWLDGWAGDQFEVVTDHSMQLLSDHVDGICKVFPGSVELIDHSDED